MDEALKLPRKFYDRDTITVAKDLLNKLLIRRFNGIEQIARIVEVEAYLGQQDLACHSSKGLTKRTQIMFGPSGYAYVYLIYGIYHCVNVVTEKAGHGSAVLLRALEPIKNVELRTQGPGLLCKAMHIDQQLNGCDLQGDELFITDNPRQTAFDIVARPRIGVAYAKEWSEELFRFYIQSNAFVSKK